MECPNCYSIYDNKYNFCPYCGAKKPELKLCLNCQKLYIDFVFCPECGEKLISEEEYREWLRHIREDHLRRVERSKSELLLYISRKPPHKNKGLIERKIKMGEITTFEEIDYWRD